MQLTILVSAMKENQKEEAAAQRWHIIKWKYDQNPLNFSETP